MKQFFLLIISSLLLLGCSKEDINYEDKFVEPSIWRADSIKLEFSPNKTLTITKGKTISKYNYVFVEKNSIETINLSTKMHSTFELYRSDVYMGFGNKAFGYYTLVKLK